MNSANGKGKPTDAVLVLGMHRGGTSAVAGLLHLLGFDLGASLMPAADGVNNKGFWENVEAFRIHERLLAALGRSRFDPRAMPVRWQEHPAFHCAVDEVRALVERDFRGVAQWAIKDPRMCRLAPVWIAALAAVGVQAKVVFVVRHPLEIARSLQAQGWISSIARSHLCWLQHMLEAEQATRGVQRVVLRYDALLADWRAEVAALGAGLSIDVSSTQADVAAAIDAFVDASDRHYVESRAAPEVHAVPAVVSDVFDAFTDRDWTRIAALGEAHERAAAAWGPCLDEAIVEATLTRLEIGQLGIEAGAQAPIDVISLRGRSELGTYAKDAAVVQRHDNRSGAAQLRFDLHARDSIEFLHVGFGDAAGVFRLARLSVDDKPVNALARRTQGPADAAIRWMASGDDAIQVVGIRGGAWVEIDLRGIAPIGDAPHRVRIAMEIERETGTAELVAIVATLARHDRDEIIHSAAQESASRYEAFRSAAANLAADHAESIARIQSELAESGRLLEDLRKQTVAADDGCHAVSIKLDELIAETRRPFWQRRSR